MDIASHPGLGCQSQAFTGMNISRHGAAKDDNWYRHIPLNRAGLTDPQCRELVSLSGYAPLDAAIHVQNPGKTDITEDFGLSADEGIACAAAGTLDGIRPETFHLAASCGSLDPGPIVRLLYFRFVATRY